MSIQLSPHFSLDEMVRSSTALRLGIDNTPDVEQISNLTQLCIVLLEPIRSLLGAPLHIDSGFRSVGLNRAVGGAWDSAHLDGRAADVIPIGDNLDAAFEDIRRSGLLFDQLIIEANAWLHIAIAPVGSAPRLNALIAEGHSGHWTYVPAPPLGELDA